MSGHDGMNEYLRLRTKYEEELSWLAENRDTTHPDKVEMLENLLAAAKAHLNLMEGLMGYMLKLEVEPDDDDEASR